MNAIFEVLDNLLVDDNTESFEILEDVGAGQRVLNNTERYALYVAQVLENQGMDTVINITGENICQYCLSIVGGWNSNTLLPLFYCLFTPTHPLPIRV